jgi:hypothetical protein
MNLRARCFLADSLVPVRLQQTTDNAEPSGWSEDLSAMIPSTMWREWDSVYLGRLEIDMLYTRLLMEVGRLYDYNGTGQSEEVNAVTLLRLRLEPA